MIIRNYSLSIVVILMLINKSRTHKKSKVLKNKILIEVRYGLFKVTALHLSKAFLISLKSYRFNYR